MPRKQQNPKKKAKPRPTAPRVSSDNAGAYSNFLWLRRLSAPPLLIAGFEIMPINYWLGISLLCIGMCLLFVEVYFERWFLNYSKLRYAALCAIAVAGVELSLIYVFFGAPIKIVAFASDVGYSRGALVDGIIWQPGLSELRLYILNETDIDYNTLEVSVRLDRLIEQIVCIGACPTCTIGVPIGPIDNSSLVPITGPGGRPDGPALPVRISGVSAFTVRCDRLQHHTRIKLLATTFVSSEPIVLDNKNTIHHEYSIMGVRPPREPRKAEYVDIRGSYVVRGKVFRIEVRDALKQQEPSNSRKAE